MMLKFKLDVSLKDDGYSFQNNIYYFLFILELWHEKKVPWNFEMPIYDIIYDITLEEIY